MPLKLLQWQHHAPGAKFFLKEIDLYENWKVTLVSQPGVVSHDSKGVKLIEEKVLVIRSSKSKKFEEFLDIIRLFEKYHQKR